MPMPIHKRLHQTVLQPVLLLLWASLCAGADAKVSVPGFSCSSGSYAFAIADHYPTLLNIGRHRVLQLDERQQGNERLSQRRIEYIGMTLELMVSSLEPTRYRLLRAEVWSRRWNIGRLSVGRRPWLSEPEPGLAPTALNGTLELAGPIDTATLRLNEGRVDRVVFQCADKGPK